MARLTIHLKNQDKMGDKLFNTVSFKGVKPGTEQSIVKRYKADHVKSYYLSGETV